MVKTPQQKITQLQFALEIAQDHLAQYRKYSEEMRKIGRGMYLSHPYMETTTDFIIDKALTDTKE